MRLRAALLATALTTTPVVTAMATTITGPYADIGGGYNLTQTQHLHDFDNDRLMKGYVDHALAASQADVRDTYSPSMHYRERVRHGDGWTGFAAFGWGFGNGLRAEVEGAYNWSGLTGMTFSQGGPRGGSTTGRTQGSDRSYGGFINVLYDIDLKRLFNIDVPVTPFVGVGAGYLWQNVSSSTVLASNSSLNLRQHGTNGSFAYQGIVGAAYDIPGVAGLQMTTEYRMVGQVESFSMGNITQSYTANYGADNSHPSYDHRFNHQFIVGVRYAFNTAPPPPPPAPAVVPPVPAVARTYLVFFDWDGAALTGRAREIVAQAAQASTHVQTTRIEVNGYTDNSAAQPGPRGQQYNLGLSLRRADSVKAELIRDGVPASAIGVQGYGEARPLVPTGPDTREPQNRRVEIILH
ncbi:OmpA family protein [Komagataeibacter rhaeticus]|uniref:OmpA family protein n=1 Tax=Komagataeibacter rhaeticus TaxID=215221 RepID=UPI0004DB0F93|nr:OmpA family protein [Komagataeibacter rhaeticus]KDU95379.1 membrane protein [Komagataeibacter rhaeticus AF1]MBL7239947.1 OmpA family protein [Komagataeibacter rhaeticus]PYD54051.1 OmpA family protein [Komagataeibacter rhaeticus]GBQ17884.1 outer membrane protein [Komagataeibacter rhaeticus DSM 16663]